MSLPAPNLSPARWRQIEDIFHAAEGCDPHRLAEFLDAACGSDLELRREVESLLHAADPKLDEAIQTVAMSCVGKSGLEPGMFLDHYRIERLLGAGGMGEVYLAYDINLSRKVALKVLPQRLTSDLIALERLRREAITLSALNHPNLLTIHEFCRAESRTFLVTEFVEGETLRELLKRGPIAPDRAAAIVLQAARALAAAHAAGVIHRDIKPENIMVRPDGVVKLLDFGIARPAMDPSVTMATTSFFGTPRYMAPEQTRGEKADARSDLFSLGAVLDEMVGREPDCEQLIRISRRLLQFDPALRYQSAAELAGALEKVRSTPSRLRAWYIAAAALACVLVASALFYQFRRSQPSQPALRSIAVLPFRNLRPDAQTDFLGTSLADQTIAKLGFTHSLTVRTLSDTAKTRSDGDLSKIARDLNADLLVTGTYLRDGDHLHINVRLLESNPERVIWHGESQLPWGNLLAIQDAVATMVLNGLSLQVPNDEHARMKAGEASNPLAYEYYLRGIDLYAATNFAAAVQMFEKSVELDPAFASAWAYLGRSYTTNASLQYGGTEQYQKAEAAYQKAIELNPVLPEAPIYMANLFTDTGRVESAVPLLRAALRSSPNNAEAHWELGYAYRYGGLLPQSLAECELARRLNPEVKINSAALNTYLYLFEYKRFLDSLPANDSPLLIFYHGLGSFYLHDVTSAAADFNRAYDLDPNLLPAQIGKAMEEGITGDKAQALQRLNQVTASMKTHGVRDPEGMYKAAQAYAVLGDVKSALAMLRQSADGGFFCYSYISRDPLLEPLHSAPEWPQTMQRIKERADQFARRFGPK